jgi:hypothetical protein
MNKTHAGRLLTLAYFLKTEMKPRNFDMGNYTCGTTACALGCCPIVFPRQWTWHDNETPILRLSQAGFEGLKQDTMLRNRSYTAASASWFFGLNEAAIRKLFYPRDEFDCFVERTPKQEARIIEKLVEQHGYTYA